MNSVPADLSSRSVLVLDPMLATGGSLATPAASCGTGGRPPPACVLAAPGASTTSVDGLVDRVVTAAVDERLTSGPSSSPAGRRGVRHSARADLSGSGGGPTGCGRPPG